MTTRCLVAGLGSSSSITSTSTEFVRLLDAVIDIHAVNSHLHQVQLVCVVFSDADIAGTELILLQTNNEFYFLSGTLGVILMVLLTVLAV